MLAAHQDDFQFRGIISSCLEPHLTTVSVEFEEKTLMDNLEKLVQEETWDMDDGSQTSILSASKSMQVYLIIPRRCSALTKNQTLLNLFKVFKKQVLKAYYATKLFMKLPKGGTGIVASGSGMDGHIKTSDKDERRMIWCYIVNTAAQELSKMIDTRLADAVDMPQVHAELSAVTTKALVTLVSGLETQSDTEMAAMTRVPWATLQSVGDQSDRYVMNIKMILNGCIPELGSRLCPDYFQFCLDKLESSCFYLNIFKCKQISESGPQQMLLDTQAVKTILLDTPSLGKQKQTSGAASYSK